MRSIIAGIALSVSACTSPGGIRAGQREVASFSGPSDGSITKPESPSAEALRIAARLDDKPSRTEVFDRLEQMGSAAAPAIPRLLCLIEEEILDLVAPHGGDWDLRRAVKTLVAIGESSIAPTVEVLVSPCGAGVGRNTTGRRCRAYLAPHVDVPSERAMLCRWREGLLIEVLVAHREKALAALRKKALDNDVRVRAATRRVILAIEE